MRNHLLIALIGLTMACQLRAEPPSAASLAPAIISVSDWGGSPPGQADPAPPGTHQITHITLHHQGETFVPGSNVAEYLRRLQRWSRQSKHWTDIPYHYVVAPDGRIYAAREESVPGDTNTEYQPQGHALVMLLGNFEDVEPTPEQLQSMVALMAWLARKHGLSAEDIASHRDFSSQTVCPGQHLYAYLQSGWLRTAVAARLKGEPVPRPFE